MEQEKGKKRREKKGPGTVPEAPTLQDFYVDPCTRLGDDPDTGDNPDSEGNGLDTGIKNIDLGDEVKSGDKPLSDHDGISRSRNTETPNYDPGGGGIPSPLDTSERREAPASAPELAESLVSSAPPMDMSEIENLRESSAPPLISGEAMVADHRQLNMDLQRFAPHQMLQPQLDSMKEESNAASHLHESSAPPMESSAEFAPPMESLDVSLESSAPPMENSASPAYKELNSSLQFLAPHQVLQPQLERMREQEVEEEEEEGNFQECLDSLKEEDIVPFTESQLHALYHNVELEKNAEFVEHWLETQVSYY